MISFKSFVQSIHDAVLKANDALMDKNTDLLDKYFTEKRIEVIDKEDVQKTKKILEPISVVMQYPTVDDEGSLKNMDIHVPLIAIVPITTSQIEKAKLTADFDMEIVNGDLQIDFSGKKKLEGLFKKERTSKGKLEIIISPQDTSDGLKLLIERYDTLLKR
jgi:hypothetical protein